MHAVNSDRSKNRKKNITLTVGRCDGG